MKTKFLAVSLIISSNTAIADCNLLADKTHWMSGKHSTDSHLISNDGGLTINGLFSSDLGTGKVSDGICYNLSSSFSQIPQISATFESGKCNGTKATFLGYLDHNNMKLFLVSSEHSTCELIPGATLILTKQPQAYG